MRMCISCKKDLVTRHQLKYCSNSCQMEHQYLVYINAWKKGKIDGAMGISTKGTSQYLRRYLINKYGERCSVCKWKKRHQKTGVVPLEMDHLDGNAGNNKENNLRLICPNCHSLTMNYRNLNKGKGRVWRTERYLKLSKKNRDKTISF